MILTLDNSTFTLAVNPDARPPLDPSTGVALKHTKARVEHLIGSLSATDRLIIPTPVLAEVLVGAGDGAPSLISQLQDIACIQVVPFDERAAIELASMTREAEALGSKRGSSTEPWQKVKFDRQIIAIAKVSGSDALYSDDEKLCSFAGSVGMQTKSTWDLPVPEKDPDLFDTD